MKEMKKEDVEKIIVHCSASPFGDAETIDGWHKKRGFDMIGYQFVILNGYRKKDDYIPLDDGLLESGRPENMQGAHCKGENANSIGICLIGDHLFSTQQLLTTLPFLLGQLMERYDLTKKNIYTHRTFNKGKTCPNMSMRDILALL